MQRSDVAGLNDVNGTLAHRDQTAVALDLVGDGVLMRAAQRRFGQRVLAPLDADALDHRIGGNERYVTVFGAFL